MPRVRKIGKVWYSDLYVGGKRVRTPLSTDRVVAEERLADMIKEREAVRFGHAPRDVKWETFKQKYLDWSKGARAENTYKRDVAAIAALEKFHRPVRLIEVTPELLERWKAARKVAGKGNATINRDLRSVKALMRKAWEWGYLREWRGASVKKLRETPGRLLFYTVEELARLLQVCRSRFSAFYDWETICRLGARAGLRRGEIYYLAWEDVRIWQDFDKELGRKVWRGVVSVTPKDGWQPKDSEQRHVPIPEDLALHLRGLKRAGKWVIGERPSLAVMSAFFRKISRKAKLKGNIHTLRHTYASHLVQAGVDLYVVSQLLGHSDMNQTKIYAHLAPRTLDDAVKRLPALTKL